MSALPSTLQSNRSGHPLYVTRPSSRTGDIMYGVTLISRDRATILLHWLHEPKFLPSWDTAALQTAKLGNVVVWEMQTEKQGEHGVSARILVEPTCKWVLQVWPSQ